jgi:hypothetical protein
VTRCTVERLMRAEGLCGIRREKTRKTTTSEGDLIVQQDNSPGRLSSRGGRDDGRRGRSEPLSQPDGRTFWL